MKTQKVKNSILYLDDVRANLEVFSAIFCDEFNVMTAQNRNSALQILNKDLIKVLICDQRMPDVKGVEFIREVNNLYPHILCMLITAYQEHEVMLDSINAARVHKFILKPWRAEEIRYAIANAIQLYDMEIERQKLILDLQLAREKALESDRLKAAFLANLSHEIRTPLNGIVGFSSLYKNGGMDPEQSKSAGKIIEESARQLMKIVEDIITASQIQTGKVMLNTTVFDLAEMMQNLQKRFECTAYSKNLSLHLKGFYSDKSMIVRTDRNKLQEVFMQLLNNAFKFTHAGSIEFGLKMEGGPVFFVHDTGIGIAQSELQSVFEWFRQGSEEFYARQYAGNGLELSIARGLVEMCGGKIGVKSKKDIGSYFWFTIPLQFVQPEVQDVRDVSG